MTGTDSYDRIRYLNRQPSEFFPLVGALLSDLEVFLSSCLLLSLQLLGLDLLGLLLENSLDQDSSVLELVTLGSQVELMVKSAIDLLGLSILPQESSKDALSSHPEDLGGHSAFAGSSAFSVSSVVSFALGFEVKSGTGT